MSALAEKFAKTERSQTLVINTEKHYDEQIYERNVTENEPILVIRSTFAHLLLRFTHESLIFCSFYCIFHSSYFLSV